LNWIPGHVTIRFAVPMRFRFLFSGKERLP
jgi:hypothetical protein